MLNRVLLLFILLIICGCATIPNDIDYNDLRLFNGLYR